MLELACEAIRSLTFVCGKIFNYSFITCDWSFYVFYFLLVQSWKVVPFNEFVHFFQVFHFIGMQLLFPVPYDPVYVFSVSCNLFFFISKFIDSDLLFFTWVWLKFYQFCLFFQRTNFYWYLLLFSLFIFYFCSFIISSLPLTVDSLIFLWLH